MSEPAAGRFQMEILLSWVLRIGVSLSSITIIAGLVLLLITGRTGYETSSAEVANLAEVTSQSESTFPTDVASTLQGASEAKPLAIITLGLMLLIATPVARVAVSVVAFALRRDPIYTALTALVLLVLILGYAAGKAGD